MGQVNFWENNNLKFIKYDENSQESWQTPSSIHTKKITSKNIFYCIGYWKSKIEKNLKTSREKWLAIVRGKKIRMMAHI